MLSLVVNDKLRVRRDYLLSQWNQQIQVTLTSSLKDWGGGGGFKIMTLGDAITF